MQRGCEERRTPNIPKLPVLEHQEPLPLRNVSQSPHCPVTEIIDDVCMGLEEAYRIADLFGERQEFIRRRYISGDTEIRLLNCDKM
jgi:hypothetical protein